MDLQVLLKGWVHGKLAAQRLEAALAKEALDLSCLGTLGCFLGTLVDRRDVAVGVSLYVEALLFCEERKDDTVLCPLLFNDRALKSQ